MGGQARLFVQVWVALIVLLALTVGATFLPIGPLKPAVNMAIAFGKAGLIFWFYMHLREEPGLVRLSALGGGVWLLILLMFVTADYLTRDWP
jgi:cytochrome c oxidase subunit 4